MNINCVIRKKRQRKEKIFIFIDIFHFFGLIEKTKVVKFLRLFSLFYVACDDKMESIL